MFPVTGCFAASLSLSHSVWHVHLYIFMFSPVRLTKHVSIVVIFLEKTLVKKAKVISMGWALVT